MAKKKKWTPFAIGKDDRLYVEAMAVMSPLIPLIDGLELMFFGREKRAYLTLEDAMEWCRKEREHHSREKYDTMLAVMEKFRNQVASGEAVEQ